MQRKQQFVELFFGHGLSSVFTIAVVLYSSSMNTAAVTAAATAAAVRSAYILFIEREFFI